MTYRSNRNQLQLLNKRRCRARILFMEMSNIYFMCSFHGFQIFTTASPYSLVLCKNLCSSSYSSLQHWLLYTVTNLKLSVFKQECGSSASIIIFLILCPREHFVTAIYCFDGFPFWTLVHLCLVILLELQVHCQNSLFYKTLLLNNNSVIKYFGSCRTPVIPSLCSGVFPHSFFLCHFGFQPFCLVVQVYVSRILCWFGLVFRLSRNVLFRFFCKVQSSSVNHCGYLKCNSICLQFLLEIHVWSC